MTKLVVIALLALLGSVTSFNVAPSVSSRSSVELGMAKGFDANSKPTKKVKSAGQVQREEAGKKYDTIAAAGGQEYCIFVRQFGGDDESWLPCGSIAVPRDVQVSDAIFGNEESLKTAIVRTFPKLQGYEAEFEYGYNLKIYPDEPVEIARKNGPKSGGLSVGNWISTLLSPVDTSKK